MDIIFRPHFFGGKNNNFDEQFVPQSVKSVLKFNPNTNIHFISSDPNFKEKHFSSDPQNNLFCYRFEDFEDDNTKLIDKLYIHLSHNPYFFEKFAITGYFYIYNLMKKLNLDEAIIVETDVLVFCDLISTLKHYDLDNIDSLLASRNTICCSYVKRIYLETFCNSAIKMYSDEEILNCLKKIHSIFDEGGICDMTINDWIHNGAYGGIFNTMNSEKKEINIVELSKLLQNKSFFDDFLSKTKYDFGSFDSDDTNQIIGSIKKIYDINNEPHFKLNDDYIKCNSIHFQGDRKMIIDEIYKKFIDTK